MQSVDHCSQPIAYQSASSTVQAEAATGTSHRSLLHPLSHVHDVAFLSSATVVHVPCPLQSTASALVHGSTTSLQNDVVTATHTQARTQARTHARTYARMHARARQAKKAPRLKNSPWDYRSAPRRKTPWLRTRAD